MPILGLGNKSTNSGLITPGIVADSLVLKHNYNAGSVMPLSDGAAFFDGSNDWISVADSSSLHHVDTVSKFTATCWVKHDTGSPSNNETIIAKYDTGANKREWRISADASDRIIVYVSDNGTNTMNAYSSYVLADTKWHHIAFTYDGSVGTANQRCTIYVDGVDYGETVSGTLPTAVNEDDAVLSIGAFTNSGGSAEEWGGYLCNAGVWSRALTQAEIKSIMWKNYSGLTSSEKTNLVSWWNLSSDANDSHGSNNGTLS